MTVQERAEIALKILEIFRKVQEKGGLPSQKREVLNLFHDVVTASDINVVEESVDILFFYLQLVNFLGREDGRIIEILNTAWEECWKEVDEYRDTVADIELELIKNLSDMEWCLTLPKCLNIMGLLVNLYTNNDIFRETVEHTYKEKWNKNMERINKDWSL